MPSGLVMHFCTSGKCSLIWGQHCLIRTNASTWGMDLYSEAIGKAFQMRTCALAIYSMTSICRCWSLTDIRRELSGADTGEVADATGGLCLSGCLCGVGGVSMELSGCVDVIFK